MAASRAFVLYVWDNDQGDVAGLFRAVGPGGGASGVDWPKRRLQRLYDCWGIGAAAERLKVSWPRQPLPRTFDIADLRPFAARLSDLYPPPRFAIRDWLAESLEDFFLTRYRDTHAEFAASADSRLPDPFALSEPSAVPIALGDYRRWNPTGIEISRRPPGFESMREDDMPLFTRASGRYSVLKKDVLERDMRARGLNPAKKKHKDVYLSEIRAKGFSIYPDDPGLPDPCVFSAASDVQAKELFLQRAATNPFINCFVIPGSDEELWCVLQRRYPHAQIHFWYAMEQHYFFEGRGLSRDRSIHIWVGTHRQECLRAFGTDRLCADMK